jgi:hypothetical protein
MAIVLCASNAFSQAQLTGNITGRAMDSSGALIPGVEVSVSSPSMIGGARTAVTDETGTYRFTQLPPGMYRVTFALGGFKTLNIDGVALSSDRTMTINGPLEVAATAEEITVTSQTPAIDLEAATVGVNWDIKKLEDLPYARSLVGLNSMLPGVFFTGTYDVGGSQFGTSSAVGGRTFGRTGNNVMAIDGLVWCQGYADYGSFEEINFTTASKGADQANAGLTMQMVVKSGSNQFHGNFTQSYERGAWKPFGQSKNIDADLTARGLSAGSNKFVSNRQNWMDIGGPIIRDRLWFFQSYSDGSLSQFVPGFISFKDGGPAVFVSKIQNPTTKLTYQLNSKMKLEASWPLDLKTQPYRGASQRIPLEASQNQHSWATYGPNLKWTDIINARTTATISINRGGYWWPDDPWSGNGIHQIATLCTNPSATNTCYRPTLANAHDVRRTDTTTSATLGPNQDIYRRPIRWTWTGDISRFQTIGGRNHEFKFGYTGWWTKSYTTVNGYPNQQIYRYTSVAADDYVPNVTPERMLQVFRNPNSVQVFDYPNTSISAFGYKAFYINDKINVTRKLNLTIGLRGDYFNSWLPSQGIKGEGPRGLVPDGGATTLPATQNFATPFIYPDIGSDKFPSHLRFVPRVSVAYDVKGDGLLAFKASYGRYTSYSSGIGSSFVGASTVNPNSTTTCTYNGWTGDIPFRPTAGNYTTVNCTGGGGRSNAGFNPADPKTWPNKLGDDLKTSYLDEFTAGVDIGFNRNTTLRLNVVRKFDNPTYKEIDLAQPFQAYTEQRCYAYSAAANTVTAVANNSVPGGDLNSGTACVWSVPASWPTKGQVNTIQMPLRDGEGKDQYTAYEIAFNKQNANGWSFLASYDASMRHENANDALTPNALLYRDDLAKWDHGVKMNGTKTLPWGFSWASTLSIQSGAWFSRGVQIRNADNSNVTQTIAGNVGRYPTVTLWDTRFTKIIKIAEKHTLEGYLEVFNLTNTNAITSWGTTIGPAAFKGLDGSLYRPSDIVSPRIVQLTAKYRF